MYKLLVLFITLIVVVLISIQVGVFYSSSAQHHVNTPQVEGLGETITKGFLYGPWIQGRNENNALEAKMATLDNGKKVFMIEDDGYTKMVSEDNAEKYYRGRMTEFDKNKWNSYSDITGYKVYRLKKIEGPPPVDEQRKIFTEKATAILNKIRATTGFEFFPINTSIYSNSEAIVQFYKNYFDINLYPLIDRYVINKTSDEELNNTGEYRKIIQLVQRYRENNINTHDELIQTLNKIRTTSSQQGFTGLTEGLTEVGNLTDAEATCYINNNDNVLKSVVANNSGVFKSPVPGLKYRVFNSYYGLNLTRTNGFYSFRHWPWGTTQQEYSSYVTQLFPLKSNSTCGFNNRLVNNSSVFQRNFLLPCILKEGTALSVDHIENGTKDYMNQERGLIRNGGAGEFYTVEWTGYFNPDVDGMWEFFTNSDDGTHLFIYDEATVKMNNGCPDESERLGGVPGLHGMQSVAKTKLLSKDTSYKLLLLFGENGGGDQIEFKYRCPNSSRARDYVSSAFSSNGDHLFLTVTPGGSGTVIKKNIYDPMTLERARQHWNTNGKPNTYTGCTDIGTTSADFVNAYTSNINLQNTMSQTDTSVALKMCDPNSNLYGNNCTINPTAVKMMDEKTQQYITNTGLMNISGQALSPVEQMSNREGFVEGLEINESLLNDYLDALQKFGNVDKHNVTTVLYTLKNTYKVDISTPENVAKFMDPYKNFEIDSLEKLSEFRYQMTTRYPGFLSETAEDILFITMMTNSGYKYNTDAYKQFLNTVTDYGISSFAILLQFMNDIATKLKINKSPLDAIQMLKSYKVNRYSDVNNVLNTLSSYFYGSGKNENITGEQFINAFNKFGVSSKNYEQFMIDNGRIASTDILQHITAFSTFGVTYVMDGSVSTYSTFTAELAKFTLPADLSTIPNYVTKNTGKLGTSLDQLSNTNAKKQALKITLYITIGIDTYMRYMDMMNDKANKIQHDLSRLIKEKNLHDFFQVDGMDANMTSKKCLSHLADRFISSIQLINKMGYTKVCSIIELFVTLRTNLNMDYTQLETYLNSNNNLFTTKYSNFLNCGEGFVPMKENFTSSNVLEGLEPVNMVKTVNSFGIYDHNQALKKSDDSWGNIPDMNSEFKKFKINTPDEYQVFMQELKIFGVSSSNMQQYLNLILNFGVEYKDIKNFTIYITKVGVTWSTFTEFITTLQNFGVRMKDLIQFMCYIYSFGIKYEASSNSVFFRFIRSMQQYKLDYTNSYNRKSMFINAMDTFVFLIEKGQKKIDCSNPMDIINNPPSEKYVEMYFDEGKPLDGKKLPYPLEKIVSVIQTMDPLLRDIKFALVLNNPMDTNPFVSYAKVNENNQLVLNLDHRDKSLSAQTMTSFIRKFVNSYTNPKNQSDMLKRLFMTGFMNDTIPDKEFQTYLTSKNIQLYKWRQLTLTIEGWNRTNNGKIETVNAYNEVADMLNIMKIFPLFGIKLMQKYVRSDDFNIPNDPKIAGDRLTLNPKNIRCEPYMKVAYRKEDCPNQTTVSSFTNMKDTISTDTPSVSDIYPGQQIHRQYNNSSSTPVVSRALTINNSSFYSPFGGKSQYSIL